MSGILLLIAPLSWVLWKESVVAEERNVEQVARLLGERTEQRIVAAISVLDRLNNQDWEACSPAHVEAMHNAAVVRPYIKSIGYYRAEERLCGAGFIQTSEVRPPRADRIYDSGVIAWWPGEDTSLAGLPLFMIRYGVHDVAMDPRQLLDAEPLEDRRAALWVEGLRLASEPANAELPEPQTLKPGLTIDRRAGRIVSRISLGTVFPIDIVVAEPLGQFWNRYLPTLSVAGIIGLLLLILWIVLVVRYSRSRFSLTGELRYALAKGQLRAEYQPIIDLETGRCIGGEALARWVRENGERIGPDVFIPVAEDAGFLPEITRAVLDATLRDVGALLKAQPDLSINLNLGPQDLDNKSFIPALKEGLDKAELPPSAIKLEITERSLINSDAVRSLIQMLRGQGHQVAIDDFGTGYSSLSYLESFAIDILKIDKSFVDAIEKEAVTSNVIGHVIEMAKSLELATVAEGVESLHQVEWLRERGVMYAQGYYFSRPLSARKFSRFVKRRSQKVPEPEPA
ncbi:MAG: EAL domain-containing protein [Xanthomonadales bacterium]|nr:EAL domain-containing protein [Xanthomonadales bacterium]